jgi:ferric-dicitrate binding protein FerR (iron transport regulator)
VECFVPNGGRKQITLPDGSVVWLNAGSLLVYPDAFNAGSRTVFLSGEGRFTVTKDESKPFIVKTNYIDVEVLGTVFNLQAYPGSDKTTTILETGKVRINDRSGLQIPVILQPNEQLVYNHMTHSFRKSNVDAAHIYSWTDGYLVFQQENLKNIIQSLERRYNVKINYSDSKFADMTFTVRFHSGETLEEALEILKQIGVNFKYKIIDHDVYIIQ